MKNGYKIELMLIEKHDKTYLEQKIVYESLKKDKELLEEYKTLKLSSVGISKREYQKRRMSFYNHIVRESELEGTKSSKPFWADLSLSSISS